MNSRFFLLPILSAFLLSHGHSQAPKGATAPLAGTVVDHAGRPLAGATVKLSSQPGLSVTDESGLFRLPDFPDPESRLRVEDVIDVEEQGMAFLVLKANAYVRLTLLDFAGREIARVVDKTLARGRYTLSPLSGVPGIKPNGIYGIRLQIGPRTYFHRMTYIGQKNRSGLYADKVPLGYLAKSSATGLDTLLVSKPGFMPAKLEVLAQGDSLPPVLLVPDSLVPWRTDDPAYLKPVTTGVTVIPLLTVGEALPMTGNPLEAFRMGGIPDGLGLAYRDGKTARLLMNHEINSTDSTHALITGPARRGAYVSEYILEKSTGRLLSGRYAFETAHISPSTFPAPGTFSRFCSGFLAGPAVGFTVPIYLTGEESPDHPAFSPLGPQAVAIVDDRAHVLPDFGKMAFENIVVAPTDDTNLTVAFALEDGPARESQLYMYVGRKVRDLRAPDPIYANGLGGGKMYVFATSGKRDEGDFRTGAMAGRWVDPLSGRAGAPLSLGSISASDLQAWSAVSADGKDSSFNFDRIEDGAYDRDRKGVFYFASTGEPSAARNRFGRIYKLDFDPRDPIGGKPPSLEIFAQGDSASGFVSPDNMDIGPDRKLVFCEDFNLAMHRPSAVWMLDLNTKGLRKLAEVDESAVPVASRPTGLKSFWETSGVIDASNHFGAGTWLINVQAHSVSGSEAGAMQSVPQGKSLVQGGQLLLLRASP